MRSWLPLFLLFGKKQEDRCEDQDHLQDEEGIGVFFRTFQVFLAFFDIFFIVHKIDVSFL